MQEAASNPTPYFERNKLGAETSNNNNNSSSNNRSRNRFLPNQRLPRFGTKKMEPHILTEQRKGLESFTTTAVRTHETTSLGCATATYHPVPKYKERFD